MQNDGLSLLPGTTIYDSETDMPIRLQDFLTCKPLIVRISQANCMACLDAILPLLDKLSHRPIILLADFSNKRFLKKIKENHNINYPCYRIKTVFPIPIEELSVPYMFITDKDLQIECLYIPHKEMLDEAKKSLEIITNRLSM